MLQIMFPVLQNASHSKIHYLQQLLKLIADTFRFMSHAGEHMLTEMVHRVRKIVVCLGESNCIKELLSLCSSLAC